MTYAMKTLTCCAQTYKQTDIAGSLIHIRISHETPCVQYAICVMWAIVKMIPYETPESYGTHENPNAI